MTQRRTSSALQYTLSPGEERGSTSPQARGPSSRTSGKTAGSRTEGRWTWTSSAVPTSSCGRKVIIQERRAGTYYEASRARCSVSTFGHLAASESTQNRNRDHPSPSLMDTSRVDAAREPENRGNTRNRRHTQAPAERTHLRRALPPGARAASRRRDSSPGMMEVTAMLTPSFRTGDFCQTVAVRGRGVRRREKLPRAQREIPL